MNPRATHLKIKVKSLAHEAKDIRHEERKALKNARHCNVEPELHKYANGHYDAFWSLRHHRVDHLRPIARVNHLAYGFLRGRSYAEMENKCVLDNKPDFSSIEKVAKRFGSPEDLSRWHAWLEEAKAHLEQQKAEMKKVA